MALARFDGRGRTTLALARVAAGDARWGRSATRSGAERADRPAVLAAGAHRQTHCVRFALCVQTVAMSQITKCAARTAPASALLGAPPNAPPPGTACRDALLQRGWSTTFGTRADQQPRSARAVRAKHATPATSSSPQACGGRVRRACGAARSTGLAASAKRVRQHFHCACLNGAAEGRAVRFYIFCQVVFSANLLGSKASPLFHTANATRNSFLASMTSASVVANPLALSAL